jgi:hypothetical protein
MYRNARRLNAVEPMFMAQRRRTTAHTKGGTPPTVLSAETDTRTPTIPGLQIQAAIVWLDQSSEVCEQHYRVASQAAGDQG